MQLLASGRPVLLPAVGAVMDDQNIVVALRWGLPISIALWALILWAVL